MVRSEKKGLSGIAAILAKHPASRSSLIPILQQRMGISANELFGVATFYTQFRFTPPGRHTILSCQGTACHVRGGNQILRELEQRLGIAAGQTTADGQFDLERVACLGCCALAPVVAVDGKVHAQVTARKVPSIISQYTGEGNARK
jgi:NADH-quinone oxidoreductase subunit E